MLPATEMAETQETDTETAEEMITEEATELYPEIPVQEETLPETGEDLLLSDETLTEIPLETETVPSEEMILAEEELLETETEAETELAAEESEITAISIDASAVAQVSQFDLGAKLWRISLTVQYADETAEVISPSYYDSAYINGEYRNVLKATTESGEEISLFLTQNIDGETFYLRPMSNEVCNITGQCTLNVLYQENDVIASTNITVMSPEWLELSAVGEQSYNVSYGEILAYHINPVSAETLMQIQAHDNNECTCYMICSRDEIGSTEFLPMETYTVQRVFRMLLIRE